MELDQIKEDVRNALKNVKERTDEGLPREVAIKLGTFKALEISMEGFEMPVKPATYSLWDKKANKGKGAEVQKPLTQETFDHIKLVMVPVEILKKAVA